MLTLSCAVAAVALGPWGMPPVALGSGDATVKLTVRQDLPVAVVSPTLYGLFFEEINFAGDGGIYAEMVRNRAFEDASTPVRWTLRLANGATGDAVLDTSTPLHASSPKSLKVTVSSAGSGVLSLVNEGYWGMSVQAGERYRLSLYARADRGFPQGIEATLQSAGGTVLGSATFTGLDASWRKFEAVLQASATHPSAQLVLRVRDTGTLWIDHVSMFPAQTWMNRENGLRSDIVEMLDALKPAFVRFPGGCWVEGDTMATAYRWKNTIGDPVGRATVPNLWGYVSTNGLGYHEYLQMCEDLGAEPLFVINCGMSHNGAVPLAQMGEYVQDALDAIEYANGSVLTSWGSMRAMAGHPDPFGLKYIEIGNENGGWDYNERYALFVNAIRAAYPDVHIVACNWGGVPTSAPVEIVDEHYYNNPDFFIANANRFDRYSRNGPRVYVGEYAVTSGSGNGNLIGALAEAAFMTGMERNSDIVTMASYAPLLANVNGIAWRPDLVYFDASRVVGTPSYHTQKLFSLNRSDVVVRSSFELVGRGIGFEPGRIGVGTWGTQAEFKDIKVVQNGVTLLSTADGSRYTKESGTWSIQNGALRQTGSGTPARATFGSPAWTNYTLTLKARKLSGDEGFLITVGHRGSADYYWWNIGGWGNTLDAIEKAVGGSKSLVGSQIPNSVEAGRWYSIRIDYLPTVMRCTLDGKLVFQEPFPPNLPLYAVAGRAGADWILKVVNVSELERTVLVAMEGSGTAQPASWGTATTLSGDSMLAENSLDDPDRVSPTTRPALLGGKSFRYRFPARSLTVLRWPASAGARHPAPVPRDPHGP